VWFLYTSGEKWRQKTCSVQATKEFLELIDFFSLPARVGRELMV